MSILVASQTDAATSSEVEVLDAVSLFVNGTIGGGEDADIQIKSEVDTWVDTGTSLTSSVGYVRFEGPAVIRINKAASAAAYGVEIIQRKLNHVW